METSNDILQEMKKFRWYHTIDLGNGIVTPGEYDHRSVLKFYGIPEDLSGKTVLDIGPAHGFFSFEFERRNAKRVVAVELPRWSDHDTSPELKKNFRESRADDTSEDYLHGALEFAIRVKRSKVERMYYNVYQISPETVGVFDIVFCGALLIHLSDPLRALYAVRSVTGEYAIISTPIDILSLNLIAKARFYGTLLGQSYWQPNIKCLKQWCRASGFSRAEKVSTFRLTNEIQKAKSFHGTVKGFA
jgi:tRNA (mo5U34)-methyltransferase